MPDVCTATDSGTEVRMIEDRGADSRLPLGSTGNLTPCYVPLRRGSPWFASPYRSGGSGTVAGNHRACRSWASAVGADVMTLFEA
jgi:hypothetical protein